MKKMMCSRCGKRPAMFFITKVEGNETKQEGLCMKCAMELNIGPIKQIMESMGISEDEVDSVSEQFDELFGEDGTGFMPGGAGTLPFMNQSEQDDDDEEDETDAEDEDDGDESDGDKPRVGPFGIPVINAKNPSEKKKSKKKKGRKFLSLYCTDLTEKAREGKIDRIIGRDNEIYRAVQILCRRSKNNPCLIGEPGVGKTAIAEGLALRIVNGDVPAKLAKKEIHLLDLTALVAGTQFRGQFESRIKGLIDEVKKEGNIILFIDEVHNLVGTGDAEGSMNAANILKPALSRGEIQIIGATTFTEYRKYIEKDAALERRLQPIKVEEPSIEETYQMLVGIKDYYENFHKVTVSDSLVHRAVVLSERYINDRFLPDKAIDLIDEACSDVNLKDKNFVRRAELQKDLDDLRFERENLMSEPAPAGEELTDAALDKRYERIAELRSKEMQREQELAALELEGVPELTVDNLARIIELWTKIPASSIREDEFERLAELDKRLKAHIIGQDEAVNAVCSAIKRSRIGLKAKRKPTSFIFVGGTGVGKTELVKRLAADLFDSPESLIRLDMSEYMEKHAVSRLIGAPPGYVGHDEGGFLTEKVRRRPWSVVLFDEMEKAHADVWSLLLQILEEGELTDSQGRKTDFRSAMIVMTSNIGARALTETAPMGFAGAAQEKARYEQQRRQVMRELEKTMRPELLGRIDEVVVFRRLTDGEIRRIAAGMTGRLCERARRQGVTLRVTDEALALLAGEGYDERYGARTLRRQLRTRLADPLAEMLAERKVGAGDCVEAVVSDGAAVLRRVGS